MTCAVGIVRSGRVWIGADSAATSDDLIATRAPKVFRAGPLLVGFAGSYRSAQVLEHGLEVPSQADGQSDLAWLSTTFLDALRQAQRRAGAIRRDAEVDGSATAYLIGYRGALYELDGEYAIGVVGEYAAIGSGGAVALGSLHATPALSPRRRVEAALEAAACHCVGVRAPFSVVAL